MSGTVSDTPREGHQIRPWQNAGKEKAIDDTETLENFEWILKNWKVLVIGNSCKGVS